MAAELSFGDLPREFSTLDGSKNVVIPVPYDGTSTWIKGADKGPSAIIEASANMELYDIETDFEAYKEGIFTDEVLAERSSPENMVAAVKKRVTNHLENNKFTVVIGGEHTVSIGAIHAHAKHINDLCVLQLDAHADLREEYEGSPYNHACVMARARELCPIVQVGIRSMDVSEKKTMDEGRVFFASDIHNTNKWAERVISVLSDNVYVTVDLDVFDPSIMPSTGIPEPGGLLWYDVLALLKGVIKEKNLVGFDVVELCPSKDNKAPDFLAAKLIYKILSYKYHLKRT
jgi:agmatinase